MCEKKAHMGVKFKLVRKINTVEIITVQITSKNNNIIKLLGDNGGFIKGAILGVRACCIDEIA